MNLIELAARIDLHLRKFILSLPPIIPTFIYSYSRKLFLKKFEKNLNFKLITPPNHLKQTLWGIEFRAPIFNAAGMFKSGFGYDVVYRQGAGAFLAGTTTSKVRLGNKKNGVLHPFIPYASSGSASNWMGLPNESHSIVAKRLSQINKQPGCPVGASIAADTDCSYNEILSGLLQGFEYYEKAGVDFIELNESCPNVSGHSSNLNFIDNDITSRLVFISEKFLKKRTKNLPVIVKFSNDIEIDALSALIDLLIDLEFDGINIGNTSTNYDFYRKKINENDIKNFVYFTSTFGGGLSGEVLKDISFEKTNFAAKYLQTKNLKREFHVIRTGGVSSSIDIIQSQKNGIPLFQWFTGYFDFFAKHGYNTYLEIYKWL